MIERNSKPGTSGLCERCVHRLESLARGGHPMPCRMTRWEGSRNIIPVVVNCMCEYFQPSPDAEPLVVEIEVQDSRGAVTC